MLLWSYFHSLIRGKNLKIILKGLQRTIEVIELSGVTLKNEKFEWNEQIQGYLKA